MITMNTYSERLQAFERKLSGAKIDLSKFSTAPVRLFSSLEEIKQFVTSPEVKVEPDIVIDGRVFRIDDDAFYNAQGRTAKFRKGSIAFKFPAEKELVVIRKIEWSLGSRDVTPVAIFDATQCAGASIMRANLHSVKNMVHLGAAVGAVLALTRQGEVIPKLSRVDEDGITCTEDKQEVTNDMVLEQVPIQCPACGKELSMTKEMTHLYCTNEDCLGKRGRKIEIFAKAIGVEYIGQGIADKLASIFNNPVEILVASEEAWKKAEELVGIGIVKRIRISINSVMSRGILTEDFIAGLNIERLGLATVKLLFENFSIDECFKEDINLKSIRGFAEDSELIIKESLRKALIELKMARDLGINFSTDKKAKVEAKVYFCITGSLSKTKEDFARDMETRGWIRLKEVTQACKYLITNDMVRRSTKWLKAEKLGVLIIDEETALKMSEQK